MSAGDSNNSNDTREFLDELSKVSSEIKRNEVKREESQQKAGSIIILVVVFAIIIGILLLGFKACSWLLSDDTSDDYTTYYQDDNGNGQLDQGEWNYTEDEDGNVVDIDDDLSNFE